MRDGYGQPKSFSDNVVDQAFGIINRVLIREYGLEHLPQGGRRLGRYDGYQPRVENFFLTIEDANQALDVIETAFFYMEHFQGTGSFQMNADFDLPFEEAVDELNQRFREHGVGYQFESGEIIRIDSQFLHSEAVKPALSVLSASIYAGANQEFLKAHEHYRHGDYKECLNECLKAFESTMKAICDKREWAYGAGDTANKLIAVCFKNSLVPSYLQSQFNSLRTSLESGIPTVRNRLGGHGQGSQQIVVPEYLAGYLLHLTASTILMLDRAESALP
jgi:hypothetical protein